MLDGPLSRRRESNPLHLFTREECDPVTLRRVACYIVRYRKVNGGGTPLRALPLSYTRVPRLTWSVLSATLKQEETPTRRDKKSPAFLVRRETRAGGLFPGPRTRYRPGPTAFRLAAGIGLTLPAWIFLFVLSDLSSFFSH